LGCGQNVYLCDTFSGVVKAGPKDPGYRGGEHSDTSRKLVEDLIRNHLCLKNVHILEGIFPDDTARRIDESVFCFCHIDVDVHDSAEDIFNWIWPKLSPGGIVVYDDYGCCRCQGIVDHVKKNSGLKDLRLLYNLSGQAVFVKI
jgi:O-methyltransferase